MGSAIVVHSQIQEELSRANEPITPRSAVAECIRLRKRIQELTMATTKTCTGTALADIPSLVVYEIIVKFLDALSFKRFANTCKIIHLRC